MTAENPRPEEAPGPAVERIKLDSDMSIYAAMELHRRLDAGLSKGDELELDLAAVEEVDSAGMQVLIHIKEVALREGKTLRLVGHSRPVVEVLELLNLEAFFGDPLVLPAAAQGSSGS